MFCSGYGRPLMEKCSKGGGNRASPAPPAAPKNQVSHFYNYIFKDEEPLSLVFYFRL